MIMALGPGIIVLDMWH